MLRGLALSAFASLIVTNLIGCNFSGLSPVEGVVMLDGVPVANASIQFIPQGSGRDATAGTNAKGEFVMSTQEPRDGVMPGAYKVVITPPANAGPLQKFTSADEAMAAEARAQPIPANPSFPVKYTRQDLTPLTQEVPAKEKKIVFDLKSN